MLRTGKTLTGELLASIEDLRSRGLPSYALPKVIGRAKKYITLVFSEDTCKIDALSEFDGVEGEYLHGKPTGRIRIVPKESSLTRRFTLRIKE